MKFSALSIGDRFIFESERGVYSKAAGGKLSWQGARGPWIKTGVRSYTHAESGGDFRIGSLSAAVVPAAERNPVRVTPRAKHAARKLVRRYGKARARRVAGAGIRATTSKRQKQHFERVRKAVNPAPRMILIEAKFKPWENWRPVASTHSKPIAQLIGKALQERGYYVRADR